MTARSGAQYPETTTCASAPCFAIVRVLLLQRSKSNRLKRTAEKDEVDDERETLHNLTSLLLTNKTIRRAQQGSTEHGSLTINSR
jgi:hypothetical protein